MRSISEINHSARTLKSPSIGHIIRLDELRDGYYSKRMAGDGFAVRPLLLSLPHRLSEMFRIEDIRICSPVSGAVTDIEPNRIDLRTGDGLNISLLLGNTDAIRWHTTVGKVLRSGDTLGMLDRYSAEKNGFGGSVMTLFTKPMQISELHVSTGFSYRGDRVAFFKVNRDSK